MLDVKTVTATHLLTCLVSQFLRCVPLDEPRAKSKKWQVILEDTVIFPEGGGQPSDTGSIYVGSGSDRSKVAVTGL